MRAAVIEKYGGRFPHSTWRTGKPLRRSCFANTDCCQYSSTALCHSGQCYTFPALLYIPSWQPLLSVPFFYRLWFLLQAGYYWHWIHQELWLQKEQNLALCSSIRKVLAHLIPFKMLWQNESIQLFLTTLLVSSKVIFTFHYSAGLPPQPRRCAEMMHLFDIH